jgi:hypothetical protein
MVAERFFVMTVGGLDAGFTVLIVPMSESAD